MAHLLFARPQELYRPPVERLGDGDGLAHLIGAAATAEAAAEESSVDKHLIGRDAGLLRRPLQRELGRLIAGPNVDAASRHHGGGIAGLHSGVGEIGHRIGRLDHL